MSFRRVTAREQCDRACGLRRSESSGAGGPTAAGEGAAGGRGQGPGVEGAETATAAVGQEVRAVTGARRHPTDSV